MAGRAARTWIPICLASLLVGGTLMSCAPAQSYPVVDPQQTHRLPHDFFAVGGGWLSDLALRGDRKGLDVHARRMSRLGIESARIPADWGTAEASRPSRRVRAFDFSALDAVVSALARHRVRPALLFVGSPVWARGSRRALCGYRSTPPPQDFAAFARAAAARYGRSGVFWRRHPKLPYMPVREYEVWNEENWLGYVCPAIDPERYAELFLATSTAIHAVDRHASVIVGGLVGLREDQYDSNLMLHGMQSVKFVSRMLSAQPQLRREIDGIGYHTYAVEPAENVDLLRWFRRGLRTLGLGRTPIIYNEFGWPTHGDDDRVTSESQRSEYIAQLATWVARSNCGVTQIAPHTWATRESDSGNAEDWFGIVDPATAVAHVSARAYSRVARRFEGRLRKPPPRGRLAICSN